MRMDYYFLSDLWRTEGVVQVIYNKADNDTFSLLFLVPGVLRIYPLDIIAVFALLEHHYIQWNAKGVAKVMYQAKNPPIMIIYPLDNEVHGE